ncbi:MAG: 2-amino-4-hydroxy-6-hydroxymethyldihydropteridine diphosphokinase [Candidatus Sedimenticola endophacoides]
MARVWLSLGSNVDRAHNIRGALGALAGEFGELVVSRVFESEAVGFDGDPFYNLVVGLETRLGVDPLVGRLRAIEARFGRRRGGDKFAPRALDIDLLTYGGRVSEETAVPLPRDEILKYAFVLLPLSEVAPEERHPRTGERYADLWAAFDQRGQRLWPVPFETGVGADPG